MIFRPVSPASAAGPPMTKLPVGLTMTRVALSIRLELRFRPNHMFAQFSFDVSLGDIRGMLGRYENGVDAFRRTLSIFDGDLALGIRA